MPKFSLSWRVSTRKADERKRKMEAYAVLESGGKQTLVHVGDKIEIEKIAVEAGQDAELTTVLAVSDGTTLKVGKPYVEGAKVVLTIDGVVKGKKVLNFKAKRRKGARRLVGHRQQLTVATVKSIA
jgi:large subunit ribosomal protein L21